MCVRSCALASHTPVCLGGLAIATYTDFFHTDKRCVRRMRLFTNNNNLLGRKFIKLLTYLFNDPEWMASAKQKHLYLHVLKLMID